MNANKFIVLFSIFLFSTVYFGFAEINIENKFAEINQQDWILPNTACISNDGNNFVVTGNTRITSQTKYLYASFQAQVRFESFQNGINYYFGFMSRQPWAKNVVWLNNDGKDRLILRTAKNGSYGSTSIATPQLEPHKWYTFRIEWKRGVIDRLERRADTVSVYLDNNLLGRYGDLDSIPDVRVPVVFDVVSQSPKEGMMEVRNVKIISFSDTTRETVLSNEVPIPPVATEPNIPQMWRNPTASIQGNKAVIENGFLRCKFDLESLRITSLFNKYIQSETIQKKSRIFVVNTQGSDVPDSNYKLVEAKEFSNCDGSGFAARWENQKMQFDLSLKLCIQNDSPEILISMEAENFGTKLLTLGITAPLIEHIRIGENVEDDYFFFPMMTGWCGKLPIRIRHAYGYMAWMQLLAVFDPKIGGGVFMYTCQKDGMPVNLIVNKRHLANEDPVSCATGGYSDDDPGDIFERVPGTAMAFRHLRYEVEPGESCELPNAILGVSRGDWHASFEHYKKWVRSWFKKRYKSSQWLNENYAYISKHPQGFLDKDKKNYIYSDQMGFDEFDRMTEWGFWWEHPGENSDKGEGGRYAIGDYDYPSKWGGLSAFRNEIEKIHEKNGYILLYTNPTVCWQESRIGKAHGKEWARMNRDGKYTYDWLSPGYGYNACCFVEGWQDYLSGRMADVLEETGADGHRLDVASSVYPCYNSLHTHYKGTVRSSVSPESMAKFLDKCASKARQVNPEAALMTENASNEYLSQFIDGYLTQQFRWDTPFYVPFKGMSAYNLIFMRFLLPEIKVLVFGFDPEDGGKRAFFNAVGQDRGSAQGEVLRYQTRTQRVLIENNDAVGTMSPEPLISTLQYGLMANYFPSENKDLWMLCNRNSKYIEGDLLSVQTKENVHYMEMLYDEPLNVKFLNGKTVINSKIQPHDVICITQLPELLKTQLDDKKLQVEIKKCKADMYVEYFIGNDDMSNSERISLQNGKGEADIKQLGKLIIKLKQGKYLIDQNVIE